MIFLRRVIRGLKVSKNIRLLSCLLQIFVIYLLYFEWLKIDHYSVSVADARINKRLELIANECRENSFISWLVLDTNSVQNKYYFQDVIGCNPTMGKQCSFSVKKANLNPFYNEFSHEIDKGSYSFLSNLNTGTAGFYPIKYFTAYPAIYKAISSTNKKLDSIGITVVKDSRRNLVYVFTLTNVVSHKRPDCDKDKVVNILEDLSIYAKGVL